MRKICSVITIVVFLVFICGFGAAYFVIPQREFSSNENRYLQTFPEFSLSALADGRYTSAFESYLSDQVMFRDEWMALRSGILSSAGNRDIGGVYLGSDGYMFEAVRDGDVFNERFDSNLAYVDAFASQYGGRTYVMLIPSASCVLSDKLPAFAPVYDGNKAAVHAASKLGNCVYIDLRGVLGNIGGNAYYKTDHHWTSWGAYAAYETWCSLAGTDFDSGRKPVLLTDAFRGTLYSKVLLDGCAWDSVYAPQVNDQVTVTADGEPGAVYDETKLGQKDKYAVFFGGNYGTVTLEYPASDGGSLLIIKDSFANCFVPFIAEDYSRITMIDLRYFSGSVKELSQEYDDVLILYGMSEFASDNNIFKLGY